MNARELADSIAADLFTTNGRTADRLVLRIDATEQDLGGWCQRAVADRIEAALVRARVAVGAGLPSRSRRAAGW